MGRKTLVGFIFILIILLITIGNRIHIIKIRKAVDYLNTNSESNNGKFTVFIEVDKKRLSLIDRENDKIISTYPIASGKPSSPSPLGSFKIIEKAPWGEGFGSRWLGLNVPWGIYGIHGTNQPHSIGGNVSKGCIRMRNSDIEKLYELVPLDTPVLIVNGEYGPFGHGFRTLKPGDRGADVLEVQKRLKQQGYYDSTLDGIYGESMKKALIDFLKDKNILLTDKITDHIYKELGIILME